ncbi:Uma2 family endonuclease [Leptolyngbya sp. FACHB-261]|uniref:Uma2 family endonuclease n=1 Tax=Leptolyngbya sp. FACHB-261 TaxID=2692806 RepID=UPI0028C4CB5D|nr:Uma2 family endonuclease [Leptolyngbya sp. FACHB-261]
MGIPEYWIVDPIDQRVSVLILNEGFYDSAEFKGEERVVSQTFPELELTVAQIFSSMVKNCKR